MIRMRLRTAKATNVRRIRKEYEARLEATAPSATLGSGSSEAAAVPAETSRAYPDPTLQIPLDLSRVSYLATAHAPDSLYSPLRDRFRIVKFPRPTVRGLDQSLPMLIVSLAAWILPFAEDELAAIMQAWPKGSARRLRLVLEAVLRPRDIAARRHGVEKYGTSSELVSHRMSCDRCPLVSASLRGQWSGIDPYRSRS